MLQQLLTLFAVIFMLWVVFEGGFGSDGDDKKKKDGEGGGLEALFKFLAVPLLLIGGALLLVGRMLWQVLKYVPEILQKLIHFLQWLTEFLAEMLGGVVTLLKHLFKDLKTTWKVGKGIVGFLKSVATTVLRVLKSLGKFFDRFMDRVFDVFSIVWEFLQKAVRVVWKMIRSSIALVVGRVFRSSSRDSSSNRSRSTTTAASSSSNTKRSTRSDFSWDTSSLLGLLLSCVFYFIGSGKEETEQSTQTVRTKESSTHTHSPSSSRPLGLWKWLALFLSNVDDEKNADYREPVRSAKSIQFYNQELSTLQAIGWQTRRRMAKV